MVRPLVVLYQEFATQTASVVAPDLNAVLVGPAYHIQDYPDDKALIEVSSYGALNMPQGSLPPLPNVPTITLAGPPNAPPGSWLVPDSVRVFFDDVRVAFVGGSDGESTDEAPFENYFTSPSGAFVTKGVKPGDTLFVHTDAVYGDTEDPSGIVAPEQNLVLTVLSVESETSLRVASNFDRVLEDAVWRIERKLQKQEIDKSFVQTSAYLEGNEIRVLGGVTLSVGGVIGPVTYARVFIAYRALRTDLQTLDTVSSPAEITAKVGRIDARNPLAAALLVARQNAGRAPIYFFGVPSNDLVGFEAARDALSVDETLYAFVPLTNDASVIAAFKTENEQLADPSRALTDGIPQKFRVVLGSGTMSTTQNIVEENADGEVEQQADALPPGNRRIEINGLDANASRLRPGDKLIISASASATPLNGTYTIAHINAPNVLEIDETFPAAFSSVQGANFVIMRPSTGQEIVPLNDQRATVVQAGVKYASRVAGENANFRTVTLQQSDATPLQIHAVQEENGNVTVLGDFESEALTATHVANAVSGRGVATGFIGSAYITAEAVDPDTVQAAAGALTIDSGVQKLITSIGGLDAVYTRLYDANGAFLTSGVLPGDIVEVPAGVTTAFGTSKVRKFVVDRVLSEQRLQIVNALNGIYRSNTSTTEHELPHHDYRVGEGGWTSAEDAEDSRLIRYRIRRQLNKDQQVQQLVGIAQSFNSRRAVLTWPDKVWVAGLVDNSLPKNADGTAALADFQPGYMLSAALGGMTAGLPSQQGFSRLGIAGISRIEHSSDYFSEKQLTELSDGGWYVFAQNSPTSLPYSIHQVTTDPSTLESGEYSIVKNFDFVSLFFLSVLEPFLGVWNVNNDTLGFVRQAMLTGIEQLKLRRVAKIGAPLKDATLTNVAISAASDDRIEVFVEVGLPKPLNVIGLHLVA